MKARMTRALRAILKDDEKFASLKKVMVGGAREVTLNIEGTSLKLTSSVAGGGKAANFEPTAGLGSEVKG